MWAKPNFYIAAMSSVFFLVLFLMMSNIPLFGGAALSYLYNSNLVFRFLDILIALAKTIILQCRLFLFKGIDRHDQHSFDLRSDAKVSIVGIQAQDFDLALLFGTDKNTRLLNPFWHGLRTV